MRVLLSLVFALAIAGCAPSDSETGGTADAVGRKTSSRGSGGLDCTSTGKLPGGRTYCVSNAGGSELKLAEPTGRGPLRLALYVHGDGAGAYRSDSAMKALLPWADAHHALLVSVLSPNRCAWWQRPSEIECNPDAPDAEAAADVEGVNADALRIVIDRVRSAYDVVDGPVFYYGSSGGSIFLTRSFLRRFGDRYPGVFALNCGGQAADLPFAWDPKKRGATQLVYTYGDRDYLKERIEAAIPFYERLGFPSERKVIPGAEHCAFDGHGRAAEVWDAYLEER